MNHRLTLQHVGGTIKNVPVIAAQGRKLFIQWGELTGVHAFDVKLNILEKTNGQWRAANPEEAKRILRSMTGVKFGERR